VNILELNEAHWSVAFLPETELPVPGPSREELPEAIFEIICRIPRTNRAGGEIADVEGIDRRILVNKSIPRSNTADRIRYSTT
jgi:hypothetical protein